MIGRTLGSYRVVEQIGMGGMATVYKAYDPDTDRYVALKILPEHYSKDPAFQERFRREAKAIARLEHIHILPVHAYGEQEGTSYLVMRLLEAGTLSDRIKRGSLPLDEASRLLSQIASALDYAHSQGIIHRDIKPSNILLDSNNNAFLTDFGIAKMVEGTTVDLTGTGIIGTPQYMSPEQCRGDKNLTPASDIYSLGVVLYEMVTGNAPFQAETPLAVIHMQLNEPLPPPRSLRPELTDAIERVILKALAKEPVSRYPSCVAMANAFAQAVSEITQRRVSDDQLDQATITPGMEPTRKSAPTAADGETTVLPRGQRLPVLAVLAVLGILILIGAVAVLSLLGGGGSPTPTTVAEAVVDTATATIPPTDEPTTTSLPTATPDLRGAAQATNAVEATINAERTALFFEGQTAEAALWTATPVVAVLPTASFERLMSQGDTLYSTGNYPAAIDHFSQALDLDPGSAWAYHNRGWAYYDLGDYDRAVADFEQVLTLDPDYTSAYLGLAYSYFDQGNFTQAIANFDALIEREPSAEAYLGRANAHKDLGQPEDALDDYIQAYTLDENYLDAYVAAGDIYDRRGQPAEALAVYQQYLEHAGDSADPDIVQRVAELEAQPASAESAYVEGDELFYDDFEDGDADGWTLDSRANVVADDDGNQVLRMISFMGGDYVHAEVGAIDWTDYALEFNVMVVDTAVGSDHFVVGAQVRVDWDRDGCTLYYVGFEEWGSYIERQGDENTCPLVTLGESPGVTLTPHEWHTVRVEVYEARLSVYVDGDLVLSVVEDGPLHYGSIGLEAGRGTTAHFDDVRVVEIFPAGAEQASRVTAFVIENSNLRDGPGGDFSLAGHAVGGDELTVVARNAESTWLYVTTASGEEAWILASRVELRGSLADVAVRNR